MLRAQPGYPAVAKDVESGNAEAPVIRSWYMRLQAIDPLTGVERMPVNEAIYRALETVLHDMSYRLSA
ncbi:MAG: hypothetical protein KatS3mg032_2334 [Cyclobacteriaceae bacterium]|nr:MAG: hypothetical protein KatS3mg032_2334 [Cyclobacteriaceae bacterium]